MELKAKDNSKIIMIVSSIFLTIIAICILVKFFLMKEFCLTYENTICLILLGLSPTLPFGGVSVSLWIDKIKEIKEITK